MKDSYVFYTDKLRGEYKDVFEQVETYVNSLAVNEDAREERLGDFLDLLLSAQEEDRSVESVTGGDIGRFCESFCADFGPKNAFLQVLDLLKGLAWPLAVISLLEALFPEDPAVGFFARRPAFNLTGFLLGWTAGMAILTLINAVTRRRVLKNGERPRLFRKPNLAGVLLAGGVLLTLALIFLAEALLPDLPQPPLWACLAASVLFLLLCRVFYKRPRRGKVRLSEVAMEGTIDETMTKKFAKLNKKRRKKGKPELTMEEFLDREEADCKKIEKTKLFYIALPFLITGGMTADLVLTDGFETPLDALIYVALMLAAEAAVMAGMWKIERLGLESRRRWIAAHREDK